MINKIKKCYGFWQANGSRALWQIISKKVAFKLNRFADRLTAQDVPLKMSSVTDSNTSTACRVYTKGIPPLRTYFIAKPNLNRVNIVTDSINKSSLFGGVGTAIIYAAFLANKKNVPLRIITRTEVAQPESIDLFFSLYNIKIKHEIQFIFAGINKNDEFDIVDNDLFVTTSWWTTKATMASVPNNKIVYVLQEDERMFYPFGDERLNCETVMRSCNIRFVINTKLLFDHFCYEGFTNIEKNGVYFEPAFPSSVFFPRNKDKQTKRKLFFYARPNNPRNLFYLGIEVLESAISKGLIDLEKWDIYMVGNHIPDVVFSFDYVPTKLQGLSWTSYAELAGNVDLALSLMYTPHPSYPPLDLAASGAVVVTNRFANKLDLTKYSNNIICADLDKDSLVDGLRCAIALIEKSQLRNENFVNNKLLNNWQEALEQVVNQEVGNV